MSLTPPEMICFALYSAQHAMQQAYADLLSGIGLTYPQYLVMMSLWGEDGRSVGTLGRELRLESSTLTPLLKRLQAQGLVTRERDPADERRVVIRLSEKGRRLEAEAAGIPAQMAGRMGMTPDQIAQLRDEITALRDRLNDSARS